MSIKAYRKFILGCSVFVLISLIILSFGRIDYNISVCLLNRDSLWAKLFDIFGEQPAFWGLLMGTVILFYTHKRSISLWNIFRIALGCILSFYFIYLIIMTPLRYSYEIFGKPNADELRVLVVAISLGISIIIAIAAPDFNAKFYKYRKQAIILIIAILTEMLLVNLMKTIWGRPRMRSISSFEEFRYWYEIAGPAISQENKSFPSGHTANAFTMLVYCIFLPEVKKIKGKFLFTFAFLWGTLVAISRIVLGAHFLSDVIAGFYITLASAYFYHRILLKK